MTATQMYCPSCGAPLAAGASFCGSCGKAVTGGVAGTGPGKPKDSPVRIVATVAMVLVAAFLIGSIVPFENGNLIAYAVGAIIAAAYVVTASRG